jgi:uncharacterized protein
MSRGKLITVTAHESYNYCADLADLCLIRMSELHPECHVITVDRADFRVYRRNRREMIPVICPP